MYECGVMFTGMRLWSSVWVFLCLDFIGKTRVYKFEERALLLTLSTCVTFYM